MKERPILFMPEMVRALRVGKKTVTRRLFFSTPDPNAAGPTVYGHRARGFAAFDGDTDDDGWPMSVWMKSGCLARIPCPYGVVGDRLWVKESCWLKTVDTLVGNVLEDGEDREVTSRTFCGLRGDAIEEGEPPHVWYGADGELPEMPPWAATYGMEWTRRNSIHMPRWASRLLLDVVDVRCERLHDITEADARAEGVTFGEPVPATINGKPGTGCFFNARDAFAYLWDAINAVRGAPWSANPFVWRVGLRLADEKRSAA